VSGLGAEFENEPLEELIEPPVAPTEPLVGLIIPLETLELGGHGTPRNPTPPLLKPGVVETVRAAAEECLTAGGDDFLVRETFTGFGKTLMALDRLTEGSGTFIICGVDFFCLKFEETLGMRAETEEEEERTIIDPREPQQLMLF